MVQNLTKLGFTTNYFFISFEFYYELTWRAFFMIKKIHFAYISFLVIIVIGITTYIGYVGYDFYNTPVSERYYHPQYDWFRPSGLVGHGLGIIGTIMILVGVVLYIMSKKYGFLTRHIRLKYILEFHIFLCTLGPILVLYHTSFKFGGIVSIAFWSMVAVVISGVIGRFIYIRIPRGIEGRALSLSEIHSTQTQLLNKIREYDLPDKRILESIETHEEKDGSFFNSKRDGRKYLSSMKKLIYEQIKDQKKRKKVFELVKAETKLNSRINNLKQMQHLFKYWHVAHKPFALIMLVVVSIHIVVTLLFGSTWIF